MFSNAPPHPVLLAPLEECEKPTRRFTQLNHSEDTILTVGTDIDLMNWEDTRIEAGSLFNRARRIHSGLEVEVKEGEEWNSPVQLFLTANELLRKAFSAYAASFVQKCILIYNAYDRPRREIIDELDIHQRVALRGQGARRNHFDFKVEDGQIMLLDVPEIPGRFGLLPSISIDQARETIWKYDDTEAFELYLKGAVELSRKSLVDVHRDPEAGMVRVENIMGTIADLNQNRKDTIHWETIIPIHEHGSAAVCRGTILTHGHWEPDRIHFYGPGRHRSMRLKSR